LSVDCNLKTLNKLTIAVINCQSIFAKRTSLWNFIEHEHPDVMIGNESWLNPKIYSSDLVPSEYNVFRKDRSDGYGGVCHNKLTSFQLTLEENSSSELIVIRLQLHNVSIIICAVYRPPKPDSLEFTNLCASISKVIQDNPSSTIYVAGDFKLLNINWQTQSVSGYNYPTALCDMFIDFLANQGLTQMVNFQLASQIF